MKTFNTTIYVAHKRKIAAVIGVILLIGTIMFSVISPASAASTTSAATLLSSGNIIPTVTNGASPLHVEGKLIKNALNQTVYLRGVNQGCFLDTPNGWWNPQGAGVYTGLSSWNPDAVKYNLDQMQAWGINEIRLFTEVDWWVNNTSNYRQNIKDTITWAGERGIYAIFTPYYVVPGAQPSLPWPPYIDASTGANIIKSSQDYIDYWVTVANELKSLPNVIFEMYNEPFGNNASRNEFFDVAQNWINAIRSTQASQPLILQWPDSIGVNFWAETGRLEWESGLEWVTGSNFYDPAGSIIYSFHVYFGQVHKYYANLTRVNCYETSDILRGLQFIKVDYLLDTLNVPVFVGEIGVNMWKTGQDLATELTWLSNSLSIYNEKMMSYSVFTWRDTSTGLRYGILGLTNGAWYCAPNQVGEILQSAIAGR